MVRGQREGRAATGGLRMYTDLAKLYDAQYSWKDYPAEVQRLEEIARRYGRAGEASWLDVACGTGKHLELLSRHFECAGVDVNPEMLRVARGRLRGVPFTRADMRSFHLPRRFGVVSSLFSAIGHLSSERDLRRAFRCMADHLLPGGVAIVEPWISPDDFREGHIHLRTYEDPSVTLVRCAYSRRNGSRSVIEYSYLIGEPGKGIRYLREVDRGLMVRPARLVALMGRTGLRSRFLRRGFTSRRGLLIGVKPLPMSQGGSAARGPAKTA
jgi:SAM-dependent methyltransferase